MVNVIAMTILPILLLVFIVDSYRPNFYSHRSVGSKFLVRGRLYFRYRCLNMMSTADSTGSVSSRIMNGLQKKFPPAETFRVIDCFTRFIQGKDFDVVLGDGKSEHNRQVANCYVEGLASKPFYDIYSGQFEWARGLEDNAEIIKKELSDFLSSQKNSNSAESEVWIGAKAAGSSYGPQWKTLGLQDRGMWDSDNVQRFPKTIDLISRLRVPSCEVFFARQGAHSGISPHSDFNNFILTCHLGVQIPAGNDKAWIRVGDDTKYWIQDKCIVLDTSIYHSTRNDADTDRYVLIVRFWHPDLTPVEVQALSFIFDFLNAADQGEDAMARFEFEQLVQTAPSSVVKKTPTSSNSNSNSKGKRDELKADKKNKAARPAKGFHRGV